ncbi:hypothetical protein PROFUN_16796, partial [Planoprotostelium fungivorum]
NAPEDHLFCIPSGCGLSSLSYTFRAYKSNRAQNLICDASAHSINETIYTRGKTNQDFIFTVKTVAACPLDQILIALRLQSPKNSIIYSEMRVSGSIVLFLFQLWTLAHSGCSPCETFHWAGNFTNSHTDKTYPLLFRITETLTEQSIRAMSGRDEQTAVTCADEQCSSMSSEPIDITVRGTLIDTAIGDSYRYSLMLLQETTNQDFIFTVKTVAACPVAPFV